MRVGFCSHFFFNCTVGRYFASWITRLDRSRFETFVYYTNEWMADDTRAIVAAADEFRHLAGRSFDVVAQRDRRRRSSMRSSIPELGMHGETFSLASLRLAPVQVAGWGHPDHDGPARRSTTSSPRDAMEPEDGARALYARSWSLLPGLGTRYATPAVGATRRPRATSDLPDDATLYLVPQSIFKIHPDNDALLAA